MNRDDYRAAMDEVQFSRDFRERTVEKLTAAAHDARKEKANMNGRKLRKIVPLAAAIIAALAITAAAAALLLRPADVAANMGDKKLAAAFESKDAMQINKTAESDGLSITLAGVVSGKSLSDFGQELDAERTYAVISIRNTDGTPIKEFPDGLVATPLVSGYAPRAVNAWTLGGGYTAFVQDGAVYYLFDYESLEMFADHTVYLAVYQGSVPSNESFTMAASGEISFADGFKAPHALFTLPMDASKASPDAVTRYFKENGLEWLLNPPAAN